MATDKWKSTSDAVRAEVRGTESLKTGKTSLGRDERNGTSLSDVAANNPIFAKIYRDLQDGVFDGGNGKLRGYNYKPKVKNSTTS